MKRDLFLNDDIYLVRYLFIIRFVFFLFLRQNVEIL